MCHFEKRLTFYGQKSLKNIIFDSKNFSSEFVRLNNLIKFSNLKSNSLKSFPKKTNNFYKNAKYRRTNKTCFLIKLSKEYSFFKNQSNKTLLKFTSEKEKMNGFKINQVLKTWKSNCYLFEMFSDIHRESKNSSLFNNPINCVTNLKILPS